MSKDLMREQFEAYRDKRNAELEAEGHKPRSKWHITNAHYPTWEASREAVVVKLPDPNEVHDSGDYCAETIDAIEALGLKVEP